MPRRRLPAGGLAVARRLAAVDPLLAPVIRRAGPCRLGRDRRGTHFAAVARSILYQQLSGTAAATILGRVLALYGGRFPTPAELLAAPASRLRRAGVSRQKQGYLRDLAARALAGEVPFRRLGGLDDEGVVAALCRVKGVGRWTAEMFLIFRLGRPDVLPVGDLGIQNAARRLYGVEPTPAALARIAEPWRPHRSAGCWYLWRSLEAPDLWT